MAGFRQPEIPREQILLWDQRLDDAIPPDHEVRLFDQIIRSSYFRQTFLDWEKTYDLTEGQPPYHPLCLCSVYIYGMLHRLRSSRSLEEACYNRIDVQWLIAGQKPDYSTLANFVKHNQALLRRIYKDTLAIAAEAQLIKLEHVAYDGTKIGADAGKGSTHKKETIAAQLAALQARVEAEEREWAQNEQRENALFGSAKRPPRITFDPVADEYRCPMGQTLKFAGSSTVEKNSGERLRRAYHCTECSACPRANQCCVNPKTGRTVKRDQYDELRERHRQHMSVPESKTQYDLRKQTVEPCFGHIKAVLGVRRFMHRGLEAVRTEWSTICAAVNFKGLLAHWDVVERVVAGA